MVFNLKFKKLNNKMVTKKDLDEAFETKKKDMQAMIDASVVTIKEDIIRTLREENSKLCERVVILENKLITMEKTVQNNLQYQRECNVVINGIPESEDHSNLEGIAVKLFNSVCFHTITGRDIVAVHRVSKKSLLVLVKFVNKKDATALVNSKNSINALNNEDIGLGHCGKFYVSHQLTPYMGELAYRCRCLKRQNLVASTKIERGVVKILVNVSNWHSINHITDIKNVIPNYDVNE